MKLFTDGDVGGGHRVARRVFCRGEVQQEACFDLSHVLYIRKEGAWEGK